MDDFELAQHQKYEDFADRLETLIFDHPLKCAAGFVVVLSLLFGLIWSIPG